MISFARAVGVLVAVTCGAHVRQACCRVHTAPRNNVSNKAAHTRHTMLPMTMPNHAPVFPDCGSYHEPPCKRSRKAFAFASSDRIVIACPDVGVTHRQTPRWITAAATMPAATGGTRVGRNRRRKRCLGMFHSEIQLVFGFSVFCTPLLLHRFFLSNCCCCCCRRLCLRCRRCCCRRRCCRCFCCHR